MKSLLIYSLSLVILTLSACSKDKIPGVYRIDIQQGNQVTQEMLSKLEPGMTKSQVSFVMGTPMLIDVFHPNRWDYIYSFHPGNGTREQRRTDTNVVVPLNEKKTGFFNGIFNVFGLGEDEAEIIEDDNETDAAEKKQKEALPENLDDSMGTQPAGQLPDIQ